ncbi:MAG: peptidoglycan-binding protein [Verrucomicrobiota bacterium]|nr:peptidoglycan-binding protein [Verrucomicrobiota bacterium]
MKRFFLCLLAVSLGAAGSLRADETVRAAQTRLKTGGFYFGEINGRYDSDTSVAITRYQIRNGLQITGKLDGATTQALGVSTAKSELPLRGFGEEAWRSLRKTDQEYLNRLVAEDARKIKPTESPATTRASAPPAPTPATAPAIPSSANYNRERLRDYIAAFVLAGLDPRVGAETEFFAERVNYFGKPGVSRETIRRDLQRYNNRWPQRAFSLAGEPEISAADDKLKVSFPLHYELRNASKHSSGKVLKTLLLEKTGADDLQIVSVDERKQR